MDDAPRAALPELYARVAQRQPERIVYMARPGLRALPSGTFTILLFMLPQIFSTFVLLWAVWWPTPVDTAETAFAVFWTVVLAGAGVAILWVIARRNPGMAAGILRAPFIRLTVTDRRVLWTLPWERRPLMEIGRERVRGALLGQVDRRGCGSAALVLWPGDPSADFDGNIHFDRLPDAAGFVDAVAGA